MTLDGDASAATDIAAPVGFVAVGAGVGRRMVVDKSISALYDGRVVSVAPFELFAAEVWAEESAVAGHSMQAVAADLVA